jgi:transposase InsO family protein
LKEKSQVFEVFKKFKVFIEKQSGYCIKSLRSNKGDEFTSNEFKEFCKANRIRRPLTIPRSPQQNGFFERNNGTILNMA